MVVVRDSKIINIVDFIFVIFIYSFNIDLTSTTFILNKY
jgi:hypothetical protein